jgi:isopenicillin-N epimerase
LDIFEEVGPQTWCNRVKELGDKLRGGITTNGGIKINSSLHPELCAGITSFELRGTSSPAVVRQLWDKYKIRIRDVGEPYGLRVSTAAYTQEGEIAKLLSRLAELC